MFEFVQPLKPALKSSIAQERVNENVDEDLNRNQNVPNGSEDSLLPATKDVLKKRARDKAFTPFRYVLNVLSILVLLAGAFHIVASGSNDYFPITVHNDK
jgi:hypothetical protein